jgi:hypothetical protein
LLDILRKNKNHLGMSLSDANLLERIKPEGLEDLAMLKTNPQLGISIVSFGTIGPTDSASHACLLLKLRTPCFSSDYFSLTWKDFGQQYALDFFITVNTAIG